MRILLVAGLDLRELDLISERTLTEYKSKCARTVHNGTHMPEEESQVNSDQVTRLRVHQIKSNLYRNIHVDGAFGGITPQGGIHLALFSERTPIPSEVVLEFDSETGAKEDKRERVQRDGLVREMEVGAILSIDTAKNLGIWLLEKVREIEAVIGVGVDDDSRSD